MGGSGDAVDGSKNVRMMRGSRMTKRDREIGGTYENSIDRLDSEYLRRPVDRIGVLDLDDDHRVPGRGLNVTAHCGRAVPTSPRCQCQPATPTRWVMSCSNRRSSDLWTGHAGNHDPGCARVERAEDRAWISVRDPYQRRNPGGVRGTQMMLETVRSPVLRVEDDGIEPRVAG